MGLRRYVPGVVAVVVLGGVVTGSTTGLFSTAADAGLHASGLRTTGGASTVPPGTFDQPATPAAPTPSAARAALPSPVLPPAPPADRPSRTKVTARLEAVDDPGMGGSFSAEVVDLSSGQRLYARRAGAPATPASTAKLLTAAAALALLGPDHVFTTEVVRSGQGRIVLVGGGDPYLARKADGSGSPQRASVADLARDTAQALKRKGTTRVSLGYDASLFSGPAWNPTWPSTYADQVTPVSALWVDEGRKSGGSPGPRVDDPARDAARAFAEALERRGVTVTSTSAAKASRKATPVATASSAPLEQVVEHLLMASDNDAAEVLLRHVGIADDRAGSSADGTRAVVRTLTRLKVWQDSDGSALADGSGLSRTTAVPADTLVRVLRLAADDRQPGLRALLTGLPVAGVEGSLRHRFGDEPSRAGRGVVRGKTGTLTGVHALAGYLRTDDGQQLAFAFLVNDATDGYAARVWLERVSAALSRCGC